MSKVPVDHITINKMTIDVFTLKIIDIKKESSSAYTYSLEKPEDITWSPGAHTHFAFDGFFRSKTYFDVELLRHMSIMSVPEEVSLSFTTRFVEPLSSYKKILMTKKVGDEIKVFRIEPMISLKRVNRPIIEISMGTGLATIRPMIKEYLSDRTDIPFLLNINVDKSQEYLYKEELDSLEDETYKNVWVKNRIELSKEIEKTNDKYENGLYYIVGSDEFLVSMVEKLTSMGINVEDIHMDKMVEGRKYILEKVKIS